MKNYTYTYTEKPHIHGLWKISENNRKLFTVFQTKNVNTGFVFRFVSTGPFLGCQAYLNPFSLVIPHSNPLPVFVYQEIPR
jgi:hypothetical protein